MVIGNGWFFIAKRQKVSDAFPIASNQLGIVRIGTREV